MEMNEMDIEVFTGLKSEDGTVLALEGDKVVVTTKTNVKMQGTIKAICDHRIYLGEDYNYYAKINDIKEIRREV